MARHRDKGVGNTGEGSGGMDRVVARQLMQEELGKTTGG